MNDDEIYASLPIQSNVEHTHDWTPAPEPADGLNPYYAAVTVISWGLGSAYRYFTDVDNPQPPPLPGRRAYDAPDTDDEDEQPVTRQGVKPRSEIGYKYIGRAPTVEQYRAYTHQRAKQR